MAVVWTQLAVGVRASLLCISLLQSLLFFLPIESFLCILHPTAFPLSADSPSSTGKVPVTPLAEPPNPEKDTQNKTEPSGK